MNGKLCAVLMALSLLEACTQPHPRSPGARVSLVVLSKPPDGHVGAVMVRPIGGGKPVLIDKPYVEASLCDTKTVQTNAVDARQVNEEFGKTLKALPAPPTTYLIYFVEGTEELKPEAKRAIERVFAELSAREPA